LGGGECHGRLAREEERAQMVRGIGIYREGRKRGYWKVLERPGRVRNALEESRQFWRCLEDTTMYYNSLEYSRM